MKTIFKILTLIFFSLQASAQAKKTDSLKIGDAIPVFCDLKNAQIGGKPMVSLSDFKRKKGVIVIFMTNNCHHCINYRERIKNLNKMYAKKGYPVIAINPFNTEFAVEDSFTEMVKLAQKDQYDFPYLHVNDTQLPNAFHLKHTPSVFLAQKVQKQWILKYKGPIDDDMDNKKVTKINFVENAVEELLKPQPKK